MSPTLYHPHTARAINVSDRQAAEWRDLGWLDDKPEKGDAEAPEACQPAPDAQTEGDDSPTDNDAPEGDAPADPAGEADATPAPTKTTTTRGRAKK